MNKIDWARKLTSRKFWAAIIGFVTAALFAFNADEMTAGKVVSLVSALSVLVAYIIGEGLVDSKNAGAILGEVIEVDEEE